MPEPKNKYVDIKHSCGYAEAGHRVDIGHYVRHKDDVSVADHLRVKPCPRCKARGGNWTWTDGAAPAAAPKPAPKSLSADKPAAKTPDA